MGEEKTKIFLVEDDQSMGFLLKDSLEMAGYKVDLCINGGAALPIFNQRDFDLCVLDIMLPEKDGFTIAEAIRSLDQMIPIVFLTAKDQKEDRIRGFKIGADDYITKPFSIEELLLRIEAILKRTRGSQRNDARPAIQQLGDLQVDIKNQKVRKAEEVIELTYREAKLLEFFCRHKEELLSRKMIARAVWGDEDVFVGRSLDVFVSRLRKILKIDPAIKINTVHGVGYRLEVNS